MFCRITDPLGDTDRASGDDILTETHDPNSLCSGRPAVFCSLWLPSSSGVTLSPVSSCLEEAVQGLDLREGERTRERESLEGKVHGTTLNISSVAKCVENIRAGWYDGSCCLCQDTPMPQCCPSRAAVATSLVLVGLQRSALPLIAAVPRFEVA